MYSAHVQSPDEPTVSAGTPPAGETPVIEPLVNGPLRVSHLESFTGGDGASMPARERMLLCRCGRSAKKPYCDGAHVKVGFRSHKLDGRPPDVRRDCAGKEITIHDNRAVCSHAQHCVRELPEVFNRQDRPWIHPDAAAADSIARTIEKCPSGALSYTRDGVLHKDLDRKPALRVDPDGPYEVVGGVLLDDPDGCRPESQEHYTLCRCGESRNKPFCDGTHRRVGCSDAADAQSAFPD